MRYLWNWMSNGYKIYQRCPLFPPNRHRRHHRYPHHTPTRILNLHPGQPYWSHWSRRQYRRIHQYPPHRRQSRHHQQQQRQRQMVAVPVGIKIGSNVAC